MRRTVGNRLSRKLGGEPAEGPYMLKRGSGESPLQNQHLSQDPNEAKARVRTCLRKCAPCRGHGTCPNPGHTREARKVSGAGRSGSRLAVGGEF